MEKPKYEHDCDNCKFLGIYEGQDLYFCPGKYNPEDKNWGIIISRQSSDPSDYKSGMYFKKQFFKAYIVEESLDEGLKRAFENKFITGLILKW